MCVSILKKYSYRKIRDYTFGLITIFAEYCIRFVKIFQYGRRVKGTK